MLNHIEFLYHPILGIPNTLIDKRPKKFRVIIWNKLCCIKLFVPISLKVRFWNDH